MNMLVRPRRFLSLVALAGALVAPAASSLDDDLWSRIAEVYEQAWNDQPFKAARGVCIEGWARMTALGDEKARQRLDRLARASGEENRLSAVNALVSAGDRATCPKLMAIAVNPRMPREERVAALVVGTAYKDVSIPAEAERLACEWSTDPKLEEGMFHILMEHATEQSRVAMESALARALPSELRLGAFDNGEVSVCSASWALSALGKIHNPRSQPALRQAAALPTNSEWSYERIHALQTLHEIGDTAYALQMLKETYESEKDPEAIVVCAGALAAIGEHAYVTSIREGMNHELENVRARSYLILSAQGDASYVEKASHDFSPTLDIYHSPGYVAFWQLTSDLEESSFPDHKRDYLMAIAREGVTDEARAIAMGTLLQWCPRLDAEEVLSICRPALVETVPVLPAEFPSHAPWPKSLIELERAWERTAVFLVAVTRFGSPEERHQALARLAPMIDNGRLSRRDHIVLGFMEECGSADALPLLISALCEDRAPQARVTAASSILGILQAAEHLEARR